MNTPQFRKSVQEKWLNYYIENRQWITHLRIWVNCNGQRRPSSSFILATLSILEPKLNQLLPLIVELSSNPDRIIAALGLNFNPDEHPTVVAKLQQMKELKDASETSDEINGSVKMLPAAPNQTPFPAPPEAKSPSKTDESCQGGRYRETLQD